jgi:hypothetical protein
MQRTPKGSISLLWLTIHLLWISSVICQEAGNESSSSLSADCAHVVGATAQQSASSGLWTFSATVSSSETGWDKYADEWRVLSDQTGMVTVFGTRALLHPHVEEQPFTRSMSGVLVPETFHTVKLVARDSVLDYCGDAFELNIREIQSSAPSPSSVGDFLPPTTTSSSTAHHHHYASSRNDSFILFLLITVLACCWTT